MQKYLPKYTGKSGINPKYRQKKSTSRTQTHIPKKYLPDTNPKCKKSTDKKYRQSVQSTKKVPTIRPRYKKVPTIRPKYKKRPTESTDNPSQVQKQVPTIRPKY